MNMILCAKCLQDQFCTNFHGIARASKGNSQKTHGKNTNDGKGQHFHCSLSFFQRLSPAVIAWILPTCGRLRAAPASGWDPSPTTKKAVVKFPSANLRIFLTHLGQVLPTHDCDFEDFDNLLKPPKMHLLRDFVVTLASFC